MSDPAFEHVHVERAAALIDVGRFDQALIEAVRGLASSPESAALAQLRCTALLGLERFADADEACAQAIRLAPEDAYGYFLRSIVLRRLADFDGELAMAREAARLDPESTEVLLRLAEAQMQSGMVRDAQATSQTLVSLDPGSTDAHELLADLALSNGDWPRAEAHYRAVLAIDPMRIHIQQTLAMVLRERKRPLAAIDVLYQAVRSNPANEALQTQLYKAVHAYLPSRLSFGADRRAAEAALPPAALAYYLDRRGRQSLLSRHRGLVSCVVTVAALGLLTVFFVLVSPSNRASGPDPEPDPERGAIQGFGTVRPPPLGTIPLDR